MLAALSIGPVGNEFLDFGCETVIFFSDRHQLWLFPFFSCVYNVFPSLSSSTQRVRKNGERETADILHDAGGSGNQGQTSHSCFLCLFVRTYHQGKLYETLVRPRSAYSTDYFPLLH